MKMFSLLCLSLLLLGCHVANAAVPRCRDEKNNAVDWYVLYKLPKLTHSSDPLIRSGVAYLYMTSNTVDKGWQLSKKKISDKDSIPGNTLAPLYNNSEAEKAFWLLYNDNPPNRLPSSKYGHTKGAVVANKKQGFWLIHSVPNYPPMPSSGEDGRSWSLPTENPAVNKSEYNYPASGEHFGQSFMCISVNNDQFDAIGLQLMYNQIIVYRRNIPNVFSHSFSVLADAAKQKRITQAPYNNKVLLKSSDSVDFISFAKSNKWQKDLYDDFVAPSLNSDLLAETWLNGRRRLPSDCVGAKVYNVQSIELNVVNVDFKSSHDHSKWAVAVEDKTNRTWVCVGDINRAGTQYSRGGGTVCLNHRKVWENYRNAVNDVEPCPKHYNTIRV